MKIVFLYAGQGSQKVGMGKDIYDHFPQYRELIDAVDPEYKEMMHNGPLEKLSETKNTQPCMALFAAGVTAVLYAYGVKPFMVAGLSLGEYSALHAASVFDSRTLIELVAFRGSEMEKASRGIACKMTAVLGFDKNLLKSACKEAQAFGYVDIVNYNCPGQYVICGEEAAVENVEKLAKEQGAKRCIAINVSGPFHTKFMQPAGNALREKFKETVFLEPLVPVVFNATADFLDSNETIPELLEKQVQSSVYFEESINRLIEKGADTFIEIGPGRVLSGFVKKINQEVMTYSIETADDLVTLIANAEEFKL